jgi:flagellar biosynthetic protein FlhB
MTRQEVIRDMKDSEGDPRVKARLQSLARAQARRRMLQKVPTADVVVVNPTKIAVALKYDVDLAPAPVVVAMGQRKLAERIKKIALNARVPVIENRPVARALLATAKVGRPIPPALYTAVAEILAFVYRQRGRLPGVAEPVLPAPRRAG